MEQQPIKTNSSQSNLSQILIAVFVIVLTIVLFALYRRRKGVRRAVLFTGLCESGKTLLFSRLIHSKFVNSHTSIKENIADYVANKNSLRVIDIPGHERLRNVFFDQYKSSARGIVFVIDSVTLQKDVRDVAEFLYNILSDNVIRNNVESILILCNKQDLSLAKGVNAIRSILEKELNTLNITKSSQLDSVDPKAKKSSLLMKNSENFEFSSLNVTVEFAESNASSQEGEVQIAELQKWLTRIA